MIILWVVLFLTSTWFLTCLCLYRIKHGDEYQIQANVTFKMVQITLSNRELFEKILRNKAINIEGYDQVFVSNQTYKKLYPKVLSEMRTRNQTIQVTLNVTPLLFGGNSIANIQDITMLDASPKIIK
ncbi:hypothetical protein [Marinicellulosiphila megalodicopiae]|uniref:hypothetical protein n=1 Tax=Marinicellulosiphila megalodicopiae TaxID=2724896 RepID=UPI003BAF9A9C